MKVLLVVSLDLDTRPGPEWGVTGRNAAWNTGFVRSVGSGPGERSASRPLLLFGCMKNRSCHVQRHIEAERRLHGQGLGQGSMQVRAPCQR